jgi:hypothetical protein
MMLASRDGVSVAGSEKGAILFGISILAMWPK